MSLDVETPLTGVAPFPTVLPTSRYPQAWKRNKPLRGPLRAIRLCLLSVLLPGLLISVPLYLRYHVYADQIYPLGMSDMRMIDGRMSTTWCQRQVVKANATFNAFLMNDSPSVANDTVPVAMTRHLVLRDDMKEYWGFYLLKGSAVTVSTCVRWPGASLVVIRGHHHLHECAFIGDDSSEEMEELERLRDLQAMKSKVEDVDIPNNDDDAPSNNPDLMQRHRVGVQFHDPDHKKHTNHTIEFPVELDEEKEADNKALRKLLSQIFYKAEKLKPDIKVVTTPFPETTAKDHMHVRREMSYNSKESDYITLREIGMMEKTDPDTSNAETDDKYHSQTSGEIFEDVLRKLEKLGDKGKSVLEKLNKQLGSVTEAPDKYEETGKIKKLLADILASDNPVDKKHQAKAADTKESKEEATLRKKREIIIQTAMVEELNEDDEKGDTAIEEGMVPDGIADHHEIVNETTLNDFSNSEFWSSFSSSEERLLNCAGLILNLPLTPNKKCMKEGSHQDHVEASLTNTVTYRVPVDGYYFFVFSSENEVQENYIRAHFNLQKSIYDVTNPDAECKNSTEQCALPLNFFSGQKMVLELPVIKNESLWNEEFVVISKCEPRSAVYAMCVLAVPLVILLFAFQ